VIFATAFRLAAYIAQATQSGATMDNQTTLIVPRRADHAHIERTALLDQVDEGLTRVGIVVLSAPWGYGKTDLACDYVRFARARAPRLPIVRADFESYEFQAFESGVEEPLDRLLERGIRARRGHASDARPSRGAQAVRSAGSARRAHGGRLRYRHATADYAFRCLRAIAPVWTASFEAGAPPAEVAADERPLVVLDDVPLLDDEAAGVLADAVRDWVRAGARVVVVCLPSAVALHAALPEARVLDGTALAVSRTELELWLRGLQVAVGCDALAVTAGVPLLVDALRAVSGDDPTLDPVFLQASERLVEHGLNEGVSDAVDRLRWAMVLLGRGRVDELHEVGVAVRTDELQIVGDAFPFFGIDAAAGTFRCVALPVERGVGVLERVASSDEVLAKSCVEVLLRRGELERAGNVASFLSDRSRLELYGRHPDEFADAANDGALATSLRSASCGADLDVRLRPGVARLAFLYGVLHDTPDRLMPELVRQYGVKGEGGSVAALLEVADFWRGLGTGRPEPGAEDPPQGRGVLTDLVRALGSAGLCGDAVAYRERLDDLCRLVPFCDGGLAAAVYAAHAAVCGLLCGDVGTVLNWVEPLAYAAASHRIDPARVSSVSDGLLDAVHACAALLVEKPSTGSAERAHGRLEACAAFFDQRGIEPVLAFVCQLEAVCLVASGREAQAVGVLRRCQTRWNARGVLVGQAVAGLCQSLVDLSGNAVSQAAARLRAVEGQAQRLEAQHVACQVRLFSSVAAVRNGGAADVDRRLLEASIRQSSMYPRASVALTIELGLLNAARGDHDEARELLKSVETFGQPSAYRLLAMVVRALGGRRSCVLDLLPRSLRLEYESLCPPTPLKTAVCTAANCFGEQQAPSRGLYVRLLGGLRAEVNGHLVSDQEWGRRKARTLLSLLALYPQTPLSRDTIIDALWGNRAEIQGRNNLNSALTSLRSSLGQKSGGPNYIVTAGNTIMLNPANVDTDVEVFERLARNVLTRRDDTEDIEVVDACDRLVELYGDGPAGEFAVPTYRVGQRIADLEGLFVDCMLLGSALALGRGDAHQARRLARAAVRARPMSHEAVRAEAAAQAALHDGETTVGVGQAPREVRPPAPSLLAG
jgi:hypothetical protein